MIEEDVYMKKGDRVKINYRDNLYEGEIFSIYNDGSTVNVKFNLDGRNVITAFPTFLVMLNCENELNIESSTKSNVKSETKVESGVEVEAVKYDKSKIVILKVAFKDLEVGTELIEIGDIFSVKTVKTLTGKFYSIPLNHFKDDCYTCESEDNIKSANDNEELVNIENVVDSEKNVLFICQYKNADLAHNSTVEQRCCAEERKDNIDLNELVAENKNTCLFTEQLSFF